MFEPLPIAYNVQDDNTVTILIVICFILCSVSLAEIWRHVWREFTCMFIRRNYSAFYESPYVQRFLIVLNVQTTLIYSLVAYILCHNYQILFYICLFTGYFLLKQLFYQLSGIIFFSYRQRYDWRRVTLLNVAIQGILVFPLTTLKIYLNISDEIFLVVIAAIVILAKLSLFYKSNGIFFKGFLGYFQNFLYLCTLEIAPLLALLGLLYGFIDIQGIIVGLQ